MTDLPPRRRPKPDASKEPPRRPRPLRWREMDSNPRSPTKIASAR
jgi:hypothetical protein